MATDFTLPDPGEGIHEAEIVAVKVSADERVEESQVLLEVETDKAVVEVPAPFTGTVTEVLVEVGDRVEVGEAVLRYEEGDGEEGKGDDTAADADDASPESETERDDEPDDDETASEEDHDEGEQDRAQRGGDRPVPAAPATRRLARELGVDLREVDPSGPDGRVLPDDVRALAGSEGGEEGDDERVEKPEPGEDEAERLGPVRREPLRSVRRTTAERLSRSWSRVPHVTHFDRADITELERFREEQVASMEDDGDDLTLTVFVLKAAVAALKEFPRFNAHFDDEEQEVVIFERHNIGLAVDTDRGLLVPVVHNVESKSLTELAREAARLQERTRDGRLERNEMRGGSFTLTNPGPIGGTGFTPIINPPQVAILGTARASWEATVVEGDEGREVVPRKLLPLCLAFDHRVNDGADAARFVSRLVEMLESPDALVRHL